MNSLKRSLDERDESNKAGSAVLRALRRSHQRLRRASFDLALLETVRAHADAWNDLADEEHWLQGRTVVAEVCDYFGDYASARSAISLSDERIRAAVEGHPAEDEHKRRIWVAIGYAHTLYRLEDFDQALLILERCESRLAATDPDALSCFGTRARLAYSLGQIARQKQEYEKSLQHFTDAVHWASERLRLKTGFLELSAPPQQTVPLEGQDRRRLSRERLLAMWTIGKALAFGVGWVHYTTGRLRAAQLSLNSGYSMLRCTGDALHRAYAQLLLASVERAAGGINDKTFDRAIARVSEAEDGLAGHPAFGLRATYERALTLLRVGDAKGALETVTRAREGLKKRPTSSPRSVRWTCNLSIVESRAKRLLGDRKGALAAANQAVNHASPSGRFEANFIEGLISRAEAILAQARPADGAAAVQPAIVDLELARALSRQNPNPKVEAACILHLARAHFRARRDREANAAFREWVSNYARRVEHAYLHDLALQVERELRFPSDRFEVTSSDSALDFEDRKNELQAFLIRVARSRTPVVSEQADLLGVTPRGLNNWIRKLTTGKKAYDLGDPPSREASPRRTRLATQRSGVTRRPK